jgi:hypothetical protein
LCRKNCKKRPLKKEKKKLNKYSKKVYVHKNLCWWNWNSEKLGDIERVHSVYQIGQTLKSSGRQLKFTHQLSLKLWELSLEVSRYLRGHTTQLIELFKLVLLSNIVLFLSLQLRRSSRGRSSLFYTRDQNIKGKKIIF